MWSERYRLLAEDWVDKEAAASLLEDLKTATMAQMQTRYGDIPVNKAEQQVKASGEWRHYIEKMVEARRAANLAKVQVEACRMEFMEEQSIEATKRAEMKL